ncbi:MAG: dihydrofolate reductase [Candidatus Neomarinimicrobiota bacterium]|nr:MAG: dihydrofolate reductase [Candidatus Neomarinimicrobiota bacterium]
MDVIAIAAVTLDGYIARSSREVVTWSRDLALFKEQTLGSPVIMGSNTFATLATELEGRTCIVVHRTDDPENILQQVHAPRCFVIGGGRTYTRFVPFLTHLYLTPHPLLFGKGIPLFPGLEHPPELSFLRLIPVHPETGIFQYQFRVHHP